MMINPNRALDFIEALWQRGQLLGFLMGAAFSAVMTSWITWRLAKQILPGRSRIENEMLRDQLGKLDAEADHLKLHLAEAKERCEASDESNDQWKYRYKELELHSGKTATSRDGLQADLARANDRIKQLEVNLEGEKVARIEQEMKAATWLSVGLEKRWEQPATADTPAFVPLTQRRTPIISVVNLKGGVGKTTITANLGITLARQGCRVLMVDLDHQGSLTALCLSKQEQQDALHSRRFLREVLDNGVPDRAGALARCTTRAGGLGVSETFLVATDETFDEVESATMTHWLFELESDDVRFRLRKALHSPEVFSNYDLVLLDCPPRLTTGCVNALAASDYALIPVQLEKVSTEAVPRLLRWLRKYTVNLCPDLAILGVIGNRVGNSGRPTVKQKELWDNLQGKGTKTGRGPCEANWGEPIKFFDRSLLRQYPPTVGPLPSLSASYQDGFRDLATAIVGEFPNNARPRAATVHPISPASAHDGRS